jgi:hypothetical protein
MDDSFTKGGPREWYNDKLVEWHLGKKNSSYIVCIPPRRPFEVSVPKRLGWLVDKDDPRLLLAALVHDHLLEDGFGTFFCAGEFYHASLKGGMKKRHALYLAIFVAIFTTTKEANNYNKEY